MTTFLRLLLNMVFLKVSESDYVLHEVTAFNPHERSLLYTLHLKVPSITFLNGVTNEAAIPMDVIVKQEISSMFETSLYIMNIQSKLTSYVTLLVLIKKFFSINEFLKKQYFVGSEQIYQQYNTVPSNNISDSFYSWDDILNWIEINKHKKFKKVVITKTFEKRDLFFLTLTTNKKNPTVFIVGGEEGMDWISSAVILNLLNDLLENIDELRLLKNNFNIYLLPILNPDGYFYSKTKDRFWSKNRQVIDTQTKCGDNSTPIGVNIDRNWFFQKTLKRLGEECNSVYIGHRPISQEESEGLSYILNNLAMNMIAFINVKGFGRYITVPYAELSKESNNHNIVMEILKSTCSKLSKQHNVIYDIGKTSSFFYNFTGNMADWVKYKLNTPLVYTVYLEDVFSVIPQSKNIKHISQQFYTIINESLLLTKDIYGPLFNYQIKAQINLSFFNTILILQLLYNISNNYLSNK